MLKKLFYLTILSFLVPLSGFTQSDYNIDDYDGQTVNTCDGYFYDSGGDAAAYGNNETFTITFHSTDALNTHIKLYFWEFDIDPSDDLYIYDGPNDASPLIGVYDNNNDLFLFPVEATITNASGDLTIKFVSDGSTTAAGWKAEIMCIPLCQDVIAGFDPDACIPAVTDTAYIDICEGDQITFVGQGTYPENGIIYTQSDGTSVFDWDFGDGNTATGQTVTHSYDVVGGYDVHLTVTDVNGCISTNAIFLRVRISMNPFTNLNDHPDVCANEEFILDFGYDGQHNFNADPIEFYSSASLDVVDTTLIPDGGAQGGDCYETSVNFTVFEPGATVTSGSDILSICANMEHSYVGDLEISLICPNGQSLLLKEYIQAGGGYLGEPMGGDNHSAYDNDPITDPSVNPPGTGWEYCWDELSTYGTINDHAYDYTLASTNYESDAPFSDLIGCPLNGTWTIQICDYWAIDNGYIFSWELNLDPSLLPISWGYDVDIVDGDWSGPYIISQTDSTVTINSNTPGDYEYFLTITDEYGCTYDTSLTVTVLPIPSSDFEVDSIQCFGDSTIVNYTGTAGSGATYTWDWNGGIVISGGTGPGPHTIDYSSAGTHSIDLQVTENGCSSDVTTITFTMPTELSVTNIIQDCDFAGSGFYGVHFDVNGATEPYSITGSGAPGSFNPPGSNHWESNGILSNSDYTIYITDYYGCTTIELNGVLDCECETFAGTMDPLDLIELCEDDCWTEVNNSDEFLDAEPPSGDVLEYYLHTNNGSMLGDIIDHNQTGYFCFNAGLGMYFDTIYYISAVAGNDVGGVVDLADTCLSVAFGVPVKWRENPVADAGDGGTICLNPAQLHATASAGTGTWTCTNQTGVIFTPSANDPDATATFPSTGVTYNLQWNVANGDCTDSDQIQVTYYETPVTYAGMNDDICGNEYDLNAEPSIGDGTWSCFEPGVQFIDETDPYSTVSVPSPGTYTFYWQEDNYGCSDIDSVTIEFFLQPMPDAGPNDTTCIGMGDPAYVLNAESTMGTGLWTGPPGTFFVDNTNPVTEVSPPSFDGPNATFWFIWSEINEDCKGQDSVQITFAFRPNALAGEEQFTCGDTIYLEADTTGSGWAEGTWTSYEGIEFSDIHDPYSNAIIVNDGVYNDSSIAVVPIIWIMDNAGCIDVDTVLHTFYEQPVADAYYLTDDDDVWICGLEFDMLAEYSIDSSEGQWQVVGAQNVDFDDIYNPETHVTVPDSGYYTFTWEEQNAYNPLCASIDTIVIHFIAIPDIFAGYDTAVCGDSFELECVEDMGTGEWAIIGQVWIEDLSDPNSWTGPYGGAQDESYNYIWTEWNGPNGECVSQDTVNIYFGKIPEPFHYMGDDTIHNCGLTTEEFNWLDAQTSQYPGFWTAPYTPNETYNPGATYATTSVTVPYHGVHYFWWVLENIIDETHSCFGWSDSVIIDFIEIPVADAGGGEDNADTSCGTEYVLHPFPSVDSAIGSWYTEDQAFFLYDSTELSFEPYDTVISEFDNTVITLVWSEDNGYGCTDKDTLYLTIAIEPSTFINWQMPECVGYESFIWAEDDTLPNYTWNFGTGIIDSTEVNAQDGTWGNYVHWNDGEPEHIVTLTATNSYGCISDLIVDTVREPDPLGINFITTPDTCNAGNGTILVQGYGGTSPTGSYAFLWLPVDTVNPNTDSLITDLYAGYYTVRITDENYCFEYDSVEVEITGLVFADFMVDTPQSTVPVNVSFTNTTINGWDYEWYFGDGESDNVEHPQHIYTEHGDSIIVMLIAYSPEGCVDTTWDTLRFIASPLIEVPNVFTPNGDGSNDYFQVNATSLRDFHGIIINRWGRTLYEWDNWQDPEAGWNGKINGTGNDASPGVYFYIITGAGMDAAETTFEYKGALHLIRQKD